MDRQSANAEQRGEIQWPRRVALACVFGSMAIAGTALASRYVAVDTNVGPGEVAVQPSLDGYATGEIEGLIGFRLPLDEPLNAGVKLKLKSAGSAANSGNAISEYAAIASNPDGEIKHVTIAAAEALGIDLLIGLAAAGIGTDYTRRILRERRAKDKHLSTVGASVASLALVTVAAGCTYQSPMVENYTQPSEWLSLPSFMPGVGVPASLARLEVSNSLVAVGAKTQVETFLHQYEESEVFYSAQAAAVEEELPEHLPTLENGQYWGVFVTDRHDNIGMDKVVKAIVKTAEPRVAFDAGDDTGGGGRVIKEDFSIRSVGEALHTVPHKFAVGGNHEGHSAHINTQLKKEGIKVLDDEVAETDGLKVAGIADPRETVMTTEEAGTGESLDSVGERLAKKTCEEGDVDIALVHSPDVGDTVAADGCAKLVISGHTHEEAAPAARPNKKLRYSITYTNGSTGGSTLLPVAVGKLRKYAEASLIRFESDGTPVGIQTIRVNPDGIREYNYYDLQNLTPTTTGQAALKPVPKQ